MSIKYIPLHAHTANGSVGDSIFRIPDYISKAKEYGLDSIAITDHGQLSAIYSFYNECKKNSIKPIIGCEVYFCDDNSNKTKRQNDHLVLLAKNNTGLNNLIAITNDANINGYYYLPRTDINKLKQYHEGLICTSACIGGSIAQLLLNNKSDEAYKLVKEFKSIFCDDFYLEIQPGIFPEQIAVNRWIIDVYHQGLADIVVTNDIHYLNQQDWYYHDIHCKIKRKLTFEDEQCYPDTCYYFMDGDDLLGHFTPAFNPVLIDCYDIKDIQHAINNTCCIAKQCNVTINSEVRMPKLELNNGKTEDETLADICYNNFMQKKNDLKDPALYMEQMIYELNTIKELGFSGYFLIVKDFLDYAKNNNIPVGPGRGSVCGSIVANLAGLTEVDSIKHSLLFERFLSPKRVGSIPDCVNFIM